MPRNGYATPVGTNSEGQRSSECPALREEVANDDARVWSGERCCQRIRAQHFARGVVPAERRGVVRDRRAVHLEDVVDEIHDPVVRQSRPGAEAALVRAIERQSRARRGDLDDKDRTGAMFPTVVTTRARHHRDVGLGLRFVVERDRPLRAHQPPRTERRSQCVFRQSDGSVMGTPLRFADDQLAAKKLDRLVLVEDADVDHAVVLRARPSPRTDRILRHGVEATARVQARQCRRMQTPWTLTAHGRQLFVDLDGPWPSTVCGP